MLSIYRIGDSRHPIWDGTGAAMVGGRWNSPGKPVIYGALSYACAMLEILVHANIGRVPATHVHVVAEAPDDIAVERLDALQLPAGWDSDDITIARQVGDRWLQEAKTAVLIAPSVVARLEWIAIVNPLHPDANQLSVSPTQPVIWDQRLFGRLA
jgi:RES domain-containing protein